MKNGIHERSCGIPPLKEGVLKDRTFKLDAMIKGYWHIMGWDKDIGIPTKELIEKLGLEKMQKKEKADGRHFN